MATRLRMNRGEGTGKMMVVSRNLFISFVMGLMSVADGAETPTSTRPAAVKSQPSTPAPDEVTRWVRRLGSRRWRQREEATEALVRLGPAARPFLVQAFEATQVFEVRLRIKEVATDIFMAAYFKEPHGFLGIRQEATTINRQGPARSAIRIVSVLLGTAAARAGLQAGDLIVRFNGKDIPHNRTRSAAGAFSKIISSLKPGTGVEILIRRGNKRNTVRAVLGPKPLYLYPPEDQVQAQKAWQAWWREGTSASPAARRGGSP